MPLTSWRETEANSCALIEHCFRRFETPLHPGASISSICASFVATGVNLERLVLERLSSTLPRAAHHPVCVAKAFFLTVRVGRVSRIRRGSLHRSRNGVKSEDAQDRRSAAPRTLSLRHLCEDMYVSFFSACCTEHPNRFRRYVSHWSKVVVSAAYAGHVREAVAPTPSLLCYRKSSRDSEFFL